MFQQYFSVAVTPKAATTCLMFGTQLNEIVYFSVVCKKLATILGKHGLLPTLNVDNSQPSMTEARLPIL
jgi:hypothetical protein